MCRCLPLEQHNLRTARAAMVATTAAYGVKAPELVAWCRGSRRPACRAWCKSAFRLLLLYTHVSTISIGLNVLTCCCATSWSSPIGVPMGANLFASTSPLFRGYFTASHHSQLLHHSAATSPLLHSYFTAPSPLPVTSQLVRSCFATTLLLINCELTAKQWLIRSELTSKCFFQRSDQDR